MEINLPQPQSPSQIATTKIELLNLKLNQQLEVKIISSKAETLTLALQTALSNKPIQVQSNLAIETRPEQTLQLLVTKLTPTAEFKVLSSHPEIQTADSIKLQNNDNQTLLKELVLKHIIPVPIDKKRINTAKIDPSLHVTTKIITAKIISVSEDNIQLKLYTTPTKETGTYTKKPNQNILQQHNPIITVKKEQIVSKDSQTNISPTLTNLKQAPVITQNIQPGQNIQLEISKEGLNPEFKIINNLKPELSLGQVVLAKVINIKNDKVQLALFEDEAPDTKNKQTINKHQPDPSNKAPLTKLPLAINDKLIANKPTADIKPSQTITVSARQLSYPAEKTIKTPLNQPPLVDIVKTLKSEQTLILEVKKTGSQPEFKIVETSQPKLNVGQLISANVIATKNNKIQLQLQLPANNPATQSKAETQSVVVTLNKNQITYTATELNTTTDKKNLTVDLNTLKPGQNIKLEVANTGIQTEFKLIQNTSNSQQKILETIKQMLPIQEPPAELINQIINNLSTINKHEKIPDTLKRIAREILESLPQVKKLHDPGQLKQTIKQSGLFLEAKLAQNSEENEAEFESDFKNQLLKLRQLIKQELAVKTEQKNQSNEINLIKDIQQKTENTLARIILNQLTSLPKDDTPRQVWIVDIPFINKDTADSVKIEFDREQHDQQNEKQLNWSVTLTVTPPELGTIHCKISCIDHAINTRFWSDNQDIVSKITSNLDYLKTQFETAGINPGHFTAHKGISNKENPQRIIDQNLFDQEV